MKKTTTKNQVMDSLQWSSEEYESRVFQSYWTWCHTYGNYPSRIQQLLANSAVNKWFLIEYQKCEEQYLKIAEVVPNHIEGLRGHYKGCTAHIMTIYNQPLLDAVKKNKAFSAMLLEHTIYYAN